MARRDLRAKLLAWYREHRRDLPWRRTSDPYAVWISEVMLQQTRVDTVIPYYERFLARWPTVDALASADPADVQAAWSGLGYYRRARLMLRAAEAIVRDHRGSVPSDVAALRALPGFGRYTAGAVGSIAYGLEAPAVDGNVSRVLARVFAIEGDVSTGDAHAEVWRHAEQLVPGEAPGELNQALIELGATVCTPKSPRCVDCPIAQVCVSLRDGRTQQIPPPRKRAARSRVEVTALLLLDSTETRVLLERQAPEGLFADLWCLPMLDGILEMDGVLDEAQRKYGFAIDRVEPPFAEVTHVLTHRDIAMRIARGLGLGLGLDPDSRDVRVAGTRLRWIALQELEKFGIPSMTVRALKARLPKSIVRKTKMPGRTTQAARAQREHSG